MKTYAVLLLAGVTLAVVGAVAVMLRRARKVMRRAHAMRPYSRLRLV